MVDTRLPVASARRLIQLAGSDRAAASRALAAMSLDEQVSAVCEAPVALRSRLLDLVPAPEAVIPLLPEAELCFTCKEVGVEDASRLLEYATDHQIVACIDLDAWNGLTPDIRKLDTWMMSLAEAGDDTLLRAARAMDAETLALYLRDHVRVELKPSGDEDWQPPEGGQTLEGQFYYIARRDDDDVAVLRRLLIVLFQHDYWLYFRMMQSVTEEMSSEIEEWALRWRTGRLEDLGFPSWDHSMRIYGHMRPERLAEVPLEPADIEYAEWQLPVWISELPVAADGRHSIFRAVAQLDERARSQFFYAFMSLANKIAVADGRELGDASTLPDTIEKAARVSSLGLEHVASANSLDPEEALRRLPLEQLFRIGVNLAPEGVRPAIRSDDEDEDAGGDEDDRSGSGDRP